MRLVVAWLVPLLLVPSGAAGALQFTDAEHVGSAQFTGDLGAFDLYGHGTSQPENWLSMNASELTIRWSTSDYYSNAGIGFSGTPEHHEAVYQNATLTAIPRNMEVELGVHPLRHAQTALTMETASSSASMAASYDDRKHIYMDTWRSSNVRNSLHIQSPNDMEVAANFTGGLSAMFWGWTIEVQSDEGTNEWITGPIQQYSLAEDTYTGTATQLQAEAMEARITLEGIHAITADAWIYDAQAVSDRLQLAVEDVHETTFYDRSQLDVHQVQERLVTAEVINALDDDATTRLETQDDESTPSNAPTIQSPNGPAWWIIAGILTVLVGIYMALQSSVGLSVREVLARMATRPLRRASMAEDASGEMLGGNSHRFTIRVRSKDVQTRLHSVAVLRGKTEGEMLESLLDDA